MRSRRVGERALRRRRSRQRREVRLGQNEDLLAFLRSTKQKVLVEASPRDRVWGIGMGVSNPDARLPARWRGRNLLGFAC
jgi:predicted NAD-dependent protein-ADP-ribosyltransferase YbiA (DUF1768 family)